MTLPPQAAPAPHAMPHTAQRTPSHGLTPLRPEFLATHASRVAIPTLPAPTPALPSSAPILPVMFCAPQRMGHMIASTLWSPCTMVAAHVLSSSRGSAHACQLGLASGQVATGRARLLAALLSTQCCRASVGTFAVVHTSRHITASAVHPQATRCRSYEASHGYDGAWPSITERGPPCAWPSVTERDRLATPWRL